MTKSLQHHKLDFLDYCAHIRGYSDATLKTYDEALDEALAVVQIEEEAGVTIVDLMPLRLKIADLKASTISKKLSAIRSFVRYLQEHNESIRLRSDHSVKVAKTLPKPLSHEHILEALEIADLQERLLVELLYTLGLRISELSALKIDQISAEWIRIVGKGSKEREVPLLPHTAELIRHYRLQEQPQHYLFEKNAQKLSENSLRYKITKLFKKVGIKMTPHQLRHSYATALLNNEARISDVSELLGHASMATTQIYTKLSNRLKMQSYQNAHPLNLKKDDE